MVRAMVAAGGAITLAYLCLFYVWGKALLTFLHVRPYASSNVIFGFIFMVSAFQLVYLPFFLTRGSYRSLCIVWMILATGLTAGFLWYLHRKGAIQKPRIPRFSQCAALAGLAVVTGVLCGLIAFHARPYGADTNYYISIINDMVYRDIICVSNGVLDVHHGLTNIFALFGIGSWAIGFRPYYTALHVMRYSGVILTILMAYHAGRTLFRDEQPVSWAGIGTALVTAGIFSFWSSMYGGAFFWQRINESKALCQLVFFPAAFTVAVQFFREDADRKLLWRQQWLIGFAAIPLAVSTMSAYPFFMLILLGALLVYDRFRHAGSSIGHAFFCVLPNILYLVVYYGAGRFFSL